MFVCCPFTIFITISKILLSIVVYIYIYIYIHIYIYVYIYIYVRDFFHLGWVGGLRCQRILVYFKGIRYDFFFFWGGGGAFRVYRVFGVLRAYRVQKACRVLRVLSV